MLRKLIALALVAALGATLAASAGGQDADPAKRRPHAVLLVMDEFLSDTLLTPDGKIDAARFPNFAALARSSTFFPNASSIYDSTPKAIPAVLDGRMPFDGMKADFGDHPTTIYTAFGRAGYRVRASEEAFPLCPRRLCGKPTTRPGILANLNRGREERFNAWVRSIQASSRPTLWVKHALLPHGPWMFLPSGKRTRPSSPDPVRGLAGVPGFYDQHVTDHNHARYLLQLGFMDRQIGKLTQRLREQGIYDRTAIAVVSDHGYSWDVGVDNRRRVNRQNVDEVAPVPLFVKAPGQKRGRVSKAYARTIDVTPTLADVAGVKLGYRPEGRSAFSRAIRRRRVVRLPDRDFTTIIKISARKLESRRRANRRRHARVLGTGVGSTIAYGDPWGGLFRVGPNRQLVGRPLAGLPVGQPGKVRAALVNPGLTREVQRSSTLLPIQLGGSIRGGRRRARRDLAFAVNGRIESVGRSFYLRNGSGESFDTVVPEGSLRDGRNDVRIFEVVGSGESLRLVPLGSN